MKRVMVVDDDLDIQLLLRLELSAEGYDVEVADNGQEAIDRLAEVEPDLMLLDVMMPVLDGWGVLEQLREHDGPPAVVMVSAFASEHGSVVRRAVELGADDFVQKPFDPARLHETIREVLALDDDQRQARRQQLLADPEV